MNASSAISRTCCGSGPIVPARRSVVTIVQSSRQSTRDEIHVRQSVAAERQQGRRPVRRRRRNARACPGALRDGRRATSGSALRPANTSKPPEKGSSSAASAFRYDGANQRQQPRRGGREARVRFVDPVPGEVADGDGRHAEPRGHLERDRRDVADDDRRRRRSPARAPPRRSRRRTL